VYSEPNVLIFLLTRFECGWQVSGGWLSVNHGPFLFLWVCLCVFLFFWVEWQILSYLEYNKRKYIKKSSLLSFCKKVDQESWCSLEWAGHRSLRSISLENYLFKKAFRPPLCALRLALRKIRKLLSTPKPLGRILPHVVLTSGPTFLFFLFPSNLLFLLGQVRIKTLFPNQSLFIRGALGTMV